MQTAEPTNASCYKPRSKGKKHWCPRLPTFKQLLVVVRAWREFSAVLRTPCRHPHVTTAKTRFRVAGGYHRKAAFLLRGTRMP